MILGEKILRKIFKGYDEKQYQPNSIDLKLGRVYTEDLKMSEIGLFNGKKFLPNYKEVETFKIDGKDCYRLLSGQAYWFEIEPAMEIPNDVAQFYLPRSSLLRCGVSLHTALGDSGFKGHLMFLAINNCKHTVIVGKGERVATAINFEVEDGSLYVGDYNE